ncbi:alpha beta-hydrolase [Lentinula edodes]|uniref:Alpha/Beta hydrolase protein n=1 Tax=Lentinula edodes TaxID=5353 RepID=UPI001E8D1357|nr:Alpha/Beta hydrolase protein [Lentinula edodes]KAH7872298.1 Alpha/Beta hydrolase protein [Lentinula edodes]KAJ3908998.1 alpha beta-hydrolase [Lentinula edodes]
MSTIYHPTQVVVLFKRIVNAISTFSISNHYLLKHAKPGNNQSEDVDGKEQANLDWPWWIFRTSWGWPWLLYGSHRREVRWSWLSISNSSGQILSATEDLYPPPTHSPRSSSSQSRKNPTKSRQDPANEETKELDTMHQLLQNPALYDPLRVPRNPIVLCHGLYGFDTRGPSSFPSLQFHYWSNVLNILRDKIKADVIVTAVPGTGSITTRAESLDRQLHSRAPGRGLNFLAHSMGGLDCRDLISRVKPTKYTPLSLTTVSTPHRGSPFMDWCSDNLGLGRLAREEQKLLARASHSHANDATTGSSSPKPQTRSTLSLSSLPSSFTTLLLSILDSPAYANLTSAHLNNVFNPSTPDDPRVKYFSVTGRMPGVNIWHPLWLPKLVVDDFEHRERQRLRESWVSDNGEYSEADSQYKPLWARDEEWGNDCLVTVQSSKWGEFLGVMDGCDHWEIRGARGLELGVDLPAIPAISLGSSMGGGDSAKDGEQDGWSLKDIGWFLKAWRKDEKVQQEAIARLPQSSGTRQKEREREREKEREKDDAVVKASTDKLSAVFDWVTERVPSPPLLGTKNISAISESEPKSIYNTISTRDNRKKNELESKEDLERFYVALSRKLYDEGL